MSAEVNETDELKERLELANQVIDEFIKEYETPQELKDDILDAPMQY